MIGGITPPLSLNQSKFLFETVFLNSGDQNLIKFILDSEIS